MRRPLHLLALLLLVASCSVITACGDDEPTDRLAPAPPRAPPPPRRSRWAWSPTSAASTTARSTSSPTTGLEQAKSELGVEGRVLTSKANSDYVPNLSTLAQQKYDLVIGVGFLMAEAMDTVASKFPDTKFAIIDVNAGGAQEQAHERRGPGLQGAGGGLPRRLHGGPLRQGQRRHDDRLRRRPEDPAGGPLHRRLPGRREGRQPGHQDASTATRRTSSTRRSARSSRSTRSSRARRSSSRSRASAASA